MFEIKVKGRETAGDTVSGMKPGRRAVMETRDFVCPDCGAVIPNDRANRRKRCPRCSYRNAKRLVTEGQRARRQEAQEDGALRTKPGPQPKPEPEETAAPSIARQRREQAAAQAARVRAQNAQCRDCRWRMLSANFKLVVGCDYCNKTGRLRDRGEGPGRCGSFEPQKGR